MNGERDFKVQGERCPGSLSFLLPRESQEISLPNSNEAQKAERLF